VELEKTRSTQRLNLHDPTDISFEHSIEQAIQTVFKLITSAYDDTEKALSCSVLI